MLFALLTLVGKAQRVQDQYYQVCLKLPTDSLLTRGDAHLKNSQYEQALICYKVASDRLTGNSSDNIEHVRQEVEALSMLGQVYMEGYAEFRRCTVCMLRAQELAERHDLKPYLPRIYNNLAGTMQVSAELYHNERFGPDTIVGMYCKSVDVSLQLKNWSDAMIGAMNIIVYGTVNDCLPLIADELKGFVRLPIPDSIMIKPYFESLCQAVLACHERDYDRAIEMFDRLPSLITVAGHQLRDFEFMAYFLKGVNLIRCGRDTEGIEAMRRAEQMAQEEDMLTYLIDVNRIMSGFYRSRGDKANADKYHLAYLENRDALLSRSSTDAMENAAVILQLDEASAQTRELQRKNQMSVYILWTVLSILALLCVILAIVLRNYRRTQRNNQFLFQQAQRLLHPEKGALVSLPDPESDPEPKPDPEPREKYLKSNLSEEAKEHIEQRIIEVMQSSDEIYSVNFSLGRLAELVGERRNNISQVINEKPGRTFNSMLSEYRIKEACRRLDDQENYGHFTIEGIAQSVGFKSRPYFVMVFKSMIGLTPSAYQKMSRQKKDA